VSDTCEGDGWVGGMDSNSNGLQCDLEIVRPSRPSSEGCLLYGHFLECIVSLEQTSILSVH
jgi:hypothetical protein